MRRMAIGMLFGATFLVGFAASGLRETVRPEGTQIRPEVAEESSAASLLGQFRTSLSAWLWLRTDLYLHGGVEMRALSVQERAAGREGVGGADHVHDAMAKHDANIVTVIPSPERDFRGIFGEIERQKSAYRDMRQHTHADPEMTLPLFRLMTWVDPPFIAGWTNGAQIMAGSHGDEGVHKAQRFLEDGLKANPISVEILTDLGTLLVTEDRPYEEAIPYYRRAIEAGKRQWNHLGENGQESLRFAYRWLSLIYRNQGSLTERRAVAKEGLELFPDDGVLKRQANPPPLILRSSQRESDAMPQHPEPHDHGHDHAGHAH